MGISRYSRSPILGLNSQYGTSTAVENIRLGIRSGVIRFQSLTLSEGQRLDTLAGKYLGSGDLWWLLAAASDIGWGLQVPGGTLIRIPNIEDVSKYLG